MKDIDFKVLAKENNTVTTSSINDACKLELSIDFIIYFGDNDIIISNKYKKELIEMLESQLEGYLNLTLKKT